jgi:uncharacterized membrane protein YhhN
VALFAASVMAAGGSWVLVLALALGAIGDLALSRPGERAFLVGMLAFSLAHLAYLVLLIAAGGGVESVMVLPSILMILFGISSEWWLAPHTGTLRWPVRGYVVIILAMGLAALGLPAGNIWALAGAMLFVLSDFILAIETFLLSPDHRLRRGLSYLVWITYICAQASLMLGLGPFV